MHRIYEQLVDVGKYCRYIEGDAGRHSPFMPIEHARAPEILATLDAARVEALAAEGFYLIDERGAPVLDNRDGCARHIIATHVAQRTRGGDFPKAGFNRQLGEQCGFGGNSAKRLPRATAEQVLPFAWRQWRMDR